MLQNMAHCCSWSDADARPELSCSLSTVCLNSVSCQAPLRLSLFLAGTMWGTGLPEELEWLPGQWTRLQRKATTKASLTAATWRTACWRTATLTTEQPEHAALLGQPCSHQGTHSADALLRRALGRAEQHLASACGHISNAGTFWSSHRVWGNHCNVKESDLTTLLGQPPCLCRWLYNSLAIPWLCLNFGSKFWCWQFWCRQFWCQNFKSYFDASNFNSMFYKCLLI